MLQAMPQALLPKQCTNGRTDGRTKNALTFQPFRAFKEGWGACCYFVTYLTRKGSQPMQLHYDIPEATLLIQIIQIHRPRWAATAIMKELQIAALAGATLGQVTSAAEKAMKNPKNLLPPSINFPENWETEKPKTAGNMMGPKLCIECVTHRPANEMTKQPHGWVCNNHTEEGNK